MRSSEIRYKHMSVVAAALLSLAMLCACASSRKAKDATEEQPATESVDSAATFVPTHPPVVIPHPWRDSGSDAQK